MTLEDRQEKIEEGVCSAGALIQALMELGPLNKDQGDLLLKAAASAKVPNVSDYEVAMAVRRVVTSLDRSTTTKKEPNDTQDQQSDR
jgi:hypothetical protein